MYLSRISSGTDAKYTILVMLMFNPYFSPPSTTIRLFSIFLSVGTGWR